MTSEAQNLSRLSTEHLLHRLRCNPQCQATQRQLIDRGEGRAVFQVLKHEQEDRLLEGLSARELHKETVILMLEVARGCADCDAGPELIGVT